MRLEEPSPGRSSSPIASSAVSEGVLSRIIAATQDAVVFIDSQARIVEFNKSAERMFGYRTAEVLGQKVNLLMAEPYSHEHDGYLRRYEETGEARAIGRIRTVEGKRKNGEIFPIELSVTALPRDLPVRYAAFLRDISEKSALQERLLEREQLASLGMSASILIHEIANPLNNMYLEAQVLQRRSRNMDEFQTTAVSSILEEIRRLTRLLEEFRHASPQSEQPATPLDLGEVAKYAALHLDQHARSAGISIHCELPDVALIIRGRVDKLRQATLNLTKNAIEAMPNGGQIIVRVRALGNLALLSINDTGPGLPEDVNVFEPFRTTKPSGTGLGLTIVKQIVTQHQGSMSWESRRDQGTTFTLSFPRIETKH